MQAFISYSFQDKEIMNKLKKALQNSDVKCYVAQHDEDYGGSLSGKLERAMDESDAVIVIITRNSSSSSSVGSEIGYAKKSGKRIIPLVESGISLPVLLQGSEYVSFTAGEFEQACRKVSRFIATKLELEEDEQEADESTEETFVIENGERQIYSYDLFDNDALVGKINSDRPVNIFIVNNRNLKLLEGDYEFAYEEGIERAKKFKFNFQPPREGTWNVVIENDESGDAEVDVTLDVK